MGADPQIADVDAKAGHSALASPPIAALLIVTVAIATRIVAWWNPVAHVDDQFYLLAGEELLRGHWPYVDVWDRKPLGLFLLYSGIAWLGSGSIIGLNLIATFFAAATAWLIRQIALRFASPKGATLAALTYLLVIPLIGGQTGQSPVFYNLIMACAGWLVVDSAATAGTSPSLRRAMASMFLCGLAMTIKQITFIEGAYFGLVLLWLLHRAGVEPGRIAIAAAAMVAVALLPTALIFAGYAIAGNAELQTFVFSTIGSIFLKGGWGSISKVAGLLFFLLHLAPLLLIAMAGAVIRRRNPDAKDAILIGWIVASLIGYVAVPHFFDHYALPVVVPLSISAATFLDRGTGPLFFGALAAFCVIQPPIRDAQLHEQSRLEFDRIAAAVDGARQGGCLYVGDGPIHLYAATGACHTTRYLFPDHLNLVIETDAVGTDTGAELNRILSLRPAVIVTKDRNADRYSRAYRRFLASLPASYRTVYVSSNESPRAVQGVRIWQRKNLASPQS